jgi:hypothetical protein
LHTFIKPHPHTNLHPAAPIPPCTSTFSELKMTTSPAPAELMLTALSNPKLHRVWLLPLISAAMARDPEGVHQITHICSKLRPRRPNPTPKAQRADRFTALLRITHKRVLPRSEESFPLRKSQKALLRGFHGLLACQHESISAPASY